jgi:hypothetical protein
LPIRCLGVSVMITTGMCSSAFAWLSSGFFCNL